MLGYFSFNFIIGIAWLNYPQANSIGCNPDETYTDSIDFALVKNELVLIDEDNPHAGTRLAAKYQQTWKGVPVLGHGGTFDAVTGEELFLKVADCISEDLNNAKPSIKVEAAIAEAHEQLKESDGDRFFPDKDKENYEVVIFITALNKAVLVYRFDMLYSLKKGGSFEDANAMILINAKNKDTIVKHKYTKAFNAEGDGGNEKIGFYRYGAGEWSDRFLDVTRTNGKCEFKKNNILVISAAENEKILDFEISNPIFCFDEVMAEYAEDCNPPSPNSREQTQAHDAYFFVTAFQDLLKNTYNFDLLKKCTAIQICVHYRNIDVAQFIYRGNSFGKFQGQTCHLIFSLNSTFTYTLVGPSTVAHEMGHGIMDVNNLFDSSRQAFAAYEAFADYCGALFKAYILRRTEPDWEVGSEIYIDADGLNALRFMDDPPKDGKSIQCTKDYGKFIQEEPENNQHFLNGIYNKAFYHMVVTEKMQPGEVFRLLLRTIEYYWTATLNFDERLCAIVMASLDQFNGLDTPESRAYTGKILQAFSRVGVFCRTVSRTSLVDGEKVKILKAKTECPQGWKTFREKFDDNNDYITFCFKVIKKKKNFIDAKRYCRKRNAHLAIVDSSKKNGFIKKLLADPSQDKAYFLGAQYDEESKNWFWQPTGDELEYTKGKIDGYDDFECLATRKLSKEKGTSVDWFRADCKEELWFICELGCS